MIVVNNKRIPFVRTNGHNLWISAAAQALLGHPNRVDIEVDNENGEISLFTNEESGAFKVTYTHDKQCKISSSIFLRTDGLKDSTRFLVHGENNVIQFNFRQVV